MSFDTYTVEFKLPTGTAGEPITPSETDYVAARNLVRDVAREMVASRFAASEGEVAFWDEVASTSELAPSLDAMLNEALVHLWYMGRFNRVGDRDHSVAMAHYNPQGGANNQGSGALYRSAKGFAVAAEGALLRADASRATAQHVEIAAPAKRTFGENASGIDNLANFVRMF